MYLLTICCAMLCFITFFRVQGDDNHVALKIHGGSDALPGMFPSIGFIVNRDGINVCGATLISNEWAVSAAHCFSGLKPEDPPPVRVVFGDLDIRDVSESHQESCFDVIIHEDYNADTLYNDIALIHLEIPVNITDYVKPVNLSTKFADTKTFRKCIVAGWGATEDGVFPDVLQHTEVKIQNGRECSIPFDSDSSFIPQLESIYIDPSFNEDLMICAGSETSDACEGDSGGPLYCTDDLSQRHVLVGVVSSGQPNCTAGLSGVYTRISAYTQWIEKNSASVATSFSLSFLICIICCGKLFSYM